MLLAFGAAVSASTGACNQQGDCPAPTAIQAGASCADDQLQCAYSLSADQAPCTSCTCAGGSWVCPSNFTCGDGGGPGGDGAPPEDGAVEATPNDTGSDDAPSEATMIDAPSEAALVDAANVDGPSEAAVIDAGADASLDGGGAG
jgi:hypothetical protein